MIEGGGRHSQRVARALFPGAAAQAQGASAAAAARRGRSAGSGAGRDSRVAKKVKAPQDEGAYLRRFPLLAPFCCTLARGAALPPPRMPTAPRRAAAAAPARGLWRLAGRWRRRGGGAAFIHFYVLFWLWLWPRFLLLSPRRLTGGGDDVEGVDGDGASRAHLPLVLLLLSHCRGVCAGGYG